MRFQDGVCVDMCAAYFRCSGCPSLARLLFLLFYLREASKPYVLKGPSMKQYGNGPDPTLIIVLYKGCLKTLYFKGSFYKTILKWSRCTSMGVPKCPGKQFGVCARYAPSTFGEPFLGACFESFFVLNLICFVMISIGYALVLWKEHLLTQGCAPG